MSAIDLVALHCDHSQSERCTASTLVKATTRDGARRLARRCGWRHRCSTTRHEYDLCPAHALDVPGETFPNWRAGFTEAIPVDSIDQARAIHAARARAIEAVR